MLYVCRIASVAFRRLLVGLNAVVMTTFRLDGRAGEFLGHHNSSPWPGAELMLSVKSDRTVTKQIVTAHGHCSHISCPDEKVINGSGKTLNILPSLHLN